MDLLKITGVNYHISDATREHIEKQCQRLQRMESMLTDIKVTIAKKDDLFKMEVQTHFTWGGEIVHIEEEGRDLWPIIDSVFDKLDNKLTKLKERHHEAQRG
jgi:ribosomal subunit interface protein